MPRDLQKQQPCVPLTAFAKSLKRGVRVVRNLGFITGALRGNVTVLSELPTFWTSTGSFMPERLWPLRHFWTPALIVFLENETCHLAASVTRVLTISFLQSLPLYLLSDQLARC